MPQINDYSLETEGSEPTGGISPNLELAGASGRALERFGGAVSEGADVLHRREAQKENADVYSQIAGLRASYTKQLQAQSSDPNFDSTKFQQQYADDVNKIGNSLNTAEGRDYFERQASRLGGALLTSAAKYQAQATYNRHRVQFQTDLNKDAQTVKDDPDQFADIVDGRQEDLAEKIKGDSKLGMIKDRMTAEANEVLAKAAIMGRADKDPGSKEEGRDGDGQRALDSGAFDKYLRPQVREQLERYVDRAAHSADTDDIRANKQQERIYKANYETWGQQAIHKLDSDSLSVHDIDNAKNPDGSPLKIRWEDHQRWENMIRDHAKQDFKGNPLVMNDVIRRVQSGEYSDLQQVMGRVGPKGLSIQQYRSVAELFKDSAEQRQAEKGLLKEFAPPDHNQASPQLWVERQNQAFADFQKKKQELRAQGKPTSSLSDPNSTDYFASKANKNKYRPTMADQMKYMQEQMARKAVAPAPGEKPDPKFFKPDEADDPKKYLERITKEKAK